MTPERQQEDDLRVTTDPRPPAPATPTTRLLRHRPDGVPVYAWVGHPGGPPVGTMWFGGPQPGGPAPAVDHRHAHDFLVVAYVERGTGLLRLGDAEHDVGAGDVLVVPPGQVMGAAGDGLTRGFVRAVFFPPDAVEGRSPGALRSWRRHPLLLPFVGPGARSVRRLHVPQADRPRWARRLTDLETEVAQGRRVGSAEAALAHLTLLLVDVARLADDPAAREAWDDPLVAAVFDVLARRSAEQLSLRDVAAEVGRTPGHVTTVVRQRTGRTVQQWLVEHRMAAARRLLEGSDLLVGAVGARVGYPDPAYFARVFRRSHGMSPAAWRHASRGGARPAGG
ncbi:transcriptional regulator, AraC family [Cellulomonas flavigena DSM 20109]|uniref:Transcriptional regulator, AraC family n=1 Tax=Cellulomonas flavigena (strain ATCC 482 / DSM 20109 / BCRC 11376 / JCM 18109 / NBRC 3775 / NCIMB 8073 / NRS 134) TaxID=446466 RepID=D5UH88_CELFN|nr:transcriptional regulator, AraC family [Cellulomonas flavigena DSM 20109]